MPARDVEGRTGGRVTRGVEQFSIQEPIPEVDIGARDLSSVGTLALHVDA